MPKLSKDFYLNEENRSKATALAGEITNILHFAPQEPLYGVSISAYLLHIVSQYNNPFSITFDSLCKSDSSIEENVLDVARTFLNKNIWERLIQLVNKYSPDFFALASVLQLEQNNSIFDFNTPTSIIQLSQQLLDIQPDEEVADICCGTGTFVTDTAINYNSAKYHGYELDFNNAITSKIKADLVDADIEINIGDVFTSVDKKPDLKFDKAFANYPFMLNIRRFNSGENFVKTAFEKIPDLSKTTSSDWFFNLLVCNSLKESGRAIGIMTKGSTWNTSDKAIRKYFVENKLIKAIIELPNKMFSNTGIPTSLIIFEKNNNSKIKIIDASKICQSGRRQNSFSAKDIQTIISLMDKESDNSKTITLDELRNNEYCLCLNRYLKESYTFENGVAFESIIKNILRGAPCKAAELDEMSSIKETDMQYLMLANIKNGIIDSNLPYLAKIDPKYEKYCLKNNNLILSKNGYPYKIAVANIEKGKKILANGNLYMIELDEDKANPYYIKAFFESEAGIATLKSITVGASIPNIGVESLRKIKIPLPSLEEQERIAKKYLATLDEIGILKVRLEKAYLKLSHILDEE